MVGNPIGIIMELEEHTVNNVNAKCMGFILGI